ncbi:hypothetical protein BDQ17DRAFT_1411488 [Cyathus striatus]|nr:hypothetical protein BDQ17DRAFT_1411488 [Cyathus striatus]
MHFKLDHVHTFVILEYWAVLTDRHRPIIHVCRDGDSKMGVKTKCSTMITFYDIHTTSPNTAWSPITWKVRFILNYKNLPYKTVYVEFPNIEETSKKLGIPPTSTKKDGSPYYTLPTIYDSSTNKALADSLRIAQYLDATYPDTPAVVMKGTEVLSLAYVDMFYGKFAPLYMCLLKPVEKTVTPRSAEYLSRRSFFGKTWAELMMLTKEDEEEGLKKVKEALTSIDGWFKSAGQEGNFIMGEKPMFVDFAVATGVESDVWKEIITWQGKRWGGFLRI